MAKIFTKNLKIFFCLGVPNAGPLNVKKFGPLHLSTKFHQNLCSSFKDMTFFRQDMPPKTPTFHLKCHRSEVFWADKFLLPGLKVVFFSKLFPLVGCCGPNGSGVMAVQSWIGHQKCTPRPVFQKNHTQNPFFLAPLQESHPETSLYLIHMLQGGIFLPSLQKMTKMAQKRAKKTPKIGHPDTFRLLTPKLLQQSASNWLSN